jgi:hypothetical protein
MKVSRAVAWAVVVGGIGACSSGTAFTSGGRPNATGGASSDGGDSSQGGDTTTGGDTTAGGDTNVGGTTSSGSGTVSGGGYAGLTCEQLAAEYATELANAKQCSTDSAQPQCTGLANASIPCGCHTHVNATRTGAITNINKILDTYSANGCPACTTPVTCTTLSTVGSCSSSGTGSTNRCVDN